MLTRLNDTYSDILKISPLPSLREQVNCALKILNTNMSDFDTLAEETTMVVDYDPVIQYLDLEFMGEHVTHALTIIRNSYMWTLYPNQNSVDASKFIHLIKNQYMPKFEWFPKKWDELAHNGFRKTVSMYETLDIFTGDKLAAFFKSVDDGI